MLQIVFDCVEHVSSALVAIDRRSIKPLCLKDEAEVLPLQNVMSTS